MNPYISVTDVTHIHHVLELQRVYDEETGTLSGRNLAIGVMMSRKTLCGLPTKWREAFPANDAIADIFHDGWCVKNVLHYADYKGIDVAENLIRAVSYGGPHLHALQLDMVWPDSAALVQLRQRFPQVEIILQVSSTAMQQADDAPESVVTRLRTYGDTVNAVLLDRSMGRGLTMSPDELLPYLRAIRTAFPHMHCAVAGGLGPDTLDVLLPIAREFPDVSIDAQSRLRPSGNALDPVDWHLAKQYLRRAIQLFKHL